MPCASSQQNVSGMASARTRRSAGLSRVEIAVKAGHVAPVIFRVVDDAPALLVWRTGRSDRADRPGGRAAELGIFLDQDDIGAGRARFDCGGKARAATTHDDNVEAFIAGVHDGIWAARWPAVVPAILPNTDPAIRPVPPG